MNEHSQFYSSAPPHLPFHLKKILLCFPTSLLAFVLLLLLYCNGVRNFYVDVPFPDKITPQSDSFLPEQTSERRSSLSTSVLNPLPLSNAHSHLFLLKKTENFHSSVDKKPKVWRKANPVLNILKPTALSKRFSVRAMDFFNGSRCEVRFFMTWISSVSSFGHRELFSIETIFNSHPNACLLIISSSMDSERGSKLLKPFRNAGYRVSAFSPDFNYLFKKTSAKAWFDGLRKGNINPGEVPLGQNLSNLLRLAVLYKFGGIYLDTDVIVLKPLNDLRNVIGAQTMDQQTGNWSRLNNAVMIFDTKHPLLYKFIQEFYVTFNGNKWGHNGPYLVSRVVSRVIDKPGFNFTVLPALAFYPVNWNRVQSLFHGPTDAAHSRWMSGKLQQIRQHSFGLHLWNKESRQLKIENGSILSRIMLDHCIFCSPQGSSL